MAYSIEDIESTTIAVGNDDEHYGHVLGIDGEPYPRVHIKPQGTVNIGNGQTPPTPIDTSGGVSPDVLSLAAAPYNVVANTDTNYTSIIASAESAAIAAGKALLFPKGAIRAHVVLKPYLKYQGAGMGGGGTILKAPLGSTDKEIVALATGPAIDVGFDGFTIDAEGTSLWCMRLKAIDDGTHGGLWYSTFANFDVKGGTGGIWLQGGNPTDGTPHQFCRFNRVLVSGRDEGDSWRGLRITGQVGQFDFDVLEVTGNGTTAMDIFIGSEEDDTNAVISDEAPYAIHFNQPTIQNAVKGLRVERAEDVHLVTAYYEGVQQCTEVSNSAGHITHTNPVYRNSGYNVGLTGFIIGVEGTSHAKITGAHWSSSAGKVKPDIVMKRTGPGWCDQDTSNKWGPTHSSASMFLFPGVAASIDMGFANIQGLLGGATTVQTLTNNIPEGTTLQVIALTDPVKFGKSGNLNFAGTLFTLPPDSVSTWVRFGTTLYLVDKGAQGYTDLDDPAWTSLTLQNSWVILGGADQVPRYRKVGSSVYVEGALQTGTTGTVFATLPVGYRPVSRKRMIIEGAGGTGILEILSTGTMSLTNLDGNVSTYSFIDGCSFSTL